MQHGREIVITLDVQDGNDNVGQHTTHGEVVRLGRGHSCQLRFADPRVARMHVVIEARAVDRVDLIDLGHGTRVNGVDVERCRLQVGDVVELGGSRVVVEAIEKAAAARTSAAVDLPPLRLPSVADPFAFPAPREVDEAVAVASDAPEGSYEYRLLASAPALDDDACETPQHGLTVELWWGHNLLHVAHLDQGASFHLGEIERGPQRCDYFVPASKLGGSRAPLVRAGKAVVLPGAAGSLNIPGEPQLSLQDLAQRDDCSPCDELAGALELTLAAGATLTLELSDLRAVVRSERRGKRAAARWTAGALLGGALAWVLVSLLGHAGLLGAMAALMPSLNDTSDDAMSDEQRFWVQHYLEAAADTERELREAEDLGDPTRDDAGGSGLRAKNEEGSMGNPNSRTATGRYALGAGSDSADPVVPRQRMLDEARRFGVIGLLNAGSSGGEGPLAAWGGLMSQGQDSADFEGNMWGSDPQDAFGAGGLGLSGIGEGGGGDGHGIGLGSIGTVGNGSGQGLGEGFGHGRGGLGRLGSGHRARAPRLRVTDTRVSGRLPPEAIQRVVHMSHGRFRACYEGALRTNPGLRGRVAVRFVISRDGTVSNASGGGDLPDGGVVSCITRAFYALTFPAPEGGIVTVSYPILLQPAQ